MTRRLAITKRVSLAQFSEGWDDCYVLIRPATYQEVKEFGERDLSTMKNEQVLDIQQQVIGEHFISGKIRIESDGDAGKSQLVDLALEDLRPYSNINNHVFLEVLGMNSDPKGR